MMTVTEEAKSHLAAALDAAAPQEEKEQSCFRIVRGQNDQLAMKVDRKSEADALVVEHAGKPVLAMDKEIEPLLDGRTLDVQPNDQGQPVLTLK